MNSQDTHLGQEERNEMKSLNNLILCILLIIIIIKSIITLPSKSATVPVVATTPENSWLLMCDMLHPGKFVFDASVADHGCSLRCIYLASSHNTSNDFFDLTIQKDHNLNDGIYCRPDHVCLFV